MLVLRHFFFSHFDGFLLRPGSTHVLNLTDELSLAKEQCLNQLGTAVLVWCFKSVKFDRVCQT